MGESVSCANPQARLAYHRAYYARNKARMRERARKRTALKRSCWLYWLLDTLEFPPEPEYVVLVPSPVRKPTLRLKRTLRTNEINELGE